MAKRSKEKTVDVELHTSVAYKGPDKRLRGYKRGKQSLPEGLASALIRAGKATRLKGGSADEEQEADE